MGLTVSTCPACPRLRISYIGFVGIRHRPATPVCFLLKSSLKSVLKNASPPCH